MGQITIRGINPDFEQQIRTVAKESGKSLSRTVLDMLAERVSKEEARGRRPAESLLSLSGGWDEADAIEFRGAIQICKQD